MLRARPLNGRFGDPVDLSKACVVEFVEHPQAETQPNDPEKQSAKMLEILDWMSEHLDLAHHLVQGFELLYGRRADAPSIILAEYPKPPSGVLELERKITEWLLEHPQSSRRIFESLPAGSFMDRPPLL